MRRPDVEAERPEPVLQPLGVLPEGGAPFGLLLHHLERSQHSGGVGRWQRGREDERARVVLEEVDHRFIGGQEAAHRGERLGEGPRDDVDVVLHPEVGAGALAVRAEDAKRVCVVDDQRGAELPGDPHQVRDVRDVAFHRVDPVDDDHRSLAAGIALELQREVRHVVMVEPLALAERQLGAVDDAGVIELVEIDRLVARQESGDEPEIGAIPGGEDHARFLAEELGERTLQLLVQVEGPVQESRAGAARAVPVQRPGRRFEYLGGGA